MNNKYTAVFQQNGKWWIGYVEEIPGVNTQGETLEEARENLQEALQMILQVNKELAKQEFCGENFIREDMLLTA